MIGDTSGSLRQTGVLETLSEEVLIALRPALCVKTELVSYPMKYTSSTCSFLSENNSIFCSQLNPHEILKTQICYVDLTVPI